MELIIGGKYKKIHHVEKWLKKKNCDVVSQMGDIMDGGFFWYTYRFKNTYFQMIYKPSYPFYLYIFKPGPTEVFSPHVFYYYLQTGKVINIHAEFETNTRLSQLNYGSHIKLKKETLQH